MKTELAPKMDLIVAKAKDKQVKLLHKTAITQASKGRVTAVGMEGKNITQDELSELGDRVLGFYLYDLHCVYLLAGGDKTFLSFSLRSDTQDSGRETLFSSPSFTEV